MKVLVASSEAVPYAKTGGLADVAGTLVPRLRERGIDARLILPFYREILEHFSPEDTGREISIALGAQKVVGRLYREGEAVYFVRADRFFDREGLYGVSGKDYDDNDFRFVFFSRAVLEACRALSFMPDVIHANDWQTGLVPLYLKTLYRESLGGIVSLLTIHNLGYQGIFPASTLTLTGLDPALFTPSVLEYWGRLSLLKAGIVSADAVSTVSSNYAREILTSEYGFGLEGVLQSRSADLYGILNGIDYEHWNPAADSHIARQFHAKSLAGKRVCRSYLVRQCNFMEPRHPLISIVGRISEQKGVDIFLGAADGIFRTGANLIVLGTGEVGLEGDLRRLAARYAKYVSLNIGFDESLAHAVYAGSDMLLMPSRYEPCGLAQLIAMRYGTVPLVRATGGLRDTVEDVTPRGTRGTGFVFRGSDPATLDECYKRARLAYADRKWWTSLVERDMRQDFSWRRSARSYASLYKSMTRSAAA